MFLQHVGFGLWAHVLQPFGIGLQAHIFIACWGILVDTCFHSLLGLASGHMFL